MTTQPSHRLLLVLALISGILCFTYQALDSDEANNSPEVADNAPIPTRPQPTPASIPARPGTPTHDEAALADIEQQLASVREEQAQMIKRRRLTPDDRKVLDRLLELTEQEQVLAKSRARELGIPLVTADGSRFSHFEGGQPVYLRDLNANASISTGATEIRSTSPYNVDGSGIEIGLWEVGGLPRDTHDDLSPRVSLGDSGSSSSHATHVAGTLIGDGSTSAGALGMAPAATIDAYIVSSVFDHSAEAGLIAATEEGSTRIYLSNHSYSTSTGWYESGGDYYWYGTFSDDDDPSNDRVERYGQYSTDSQTIDTLATDYPYLAMFYAAGNSRGYDTPPNGETWSLNGNTDYTYDPTIHPGDNEDWMTDDGITGYGTISPQSSSKNVIAIGAVEDAVSGGSRSVAAADMSDFSSYGPTDDGRIKPDLVANGVSVTSASNSSDDGTATASGTSMASPNAAGTAALLTEYFGERFPGESMRASMLKALLIHTADDLGNPGPDYRYGWGLIDAKAAADLIKDTSSNDTTSRLIDGLLSDSDASDSFTFDYDGSGELRVTLVWNDPEASAAISHDDRTSRLVHDLNLTVTGPDGTHYPFVMPWAGDWSDAKLNDTATTGVNSTDNVEQVLISSPVSGTYTVTVDHAGSISGDQIYSLALTGGDFESEAPVAGANFQREVTSGFGTHTLINGHDFFSSAHDTTFTATSDDETEVTASVDANGDVILTEVGIGTTVITVTATNDLGQSATVQFIFITRNNIIFVRAENNGQGRNGSSWVRAYNTLWEALDAATSGQEIWVADGTYYPDVPSANPNYGDQTSSFDLVGNVAIYGGFAGNETSLDERDPDTNLTILSGDLGGDDTTNDDGVTETAADINGSNSWMIVRGKGSNFRLDGFTITGGKTNAELSLDNTGPGLFVEAGRNNGVIANCRFLGFSSEGGGGAVYVEGSGTIFENCHFSGSEAAGNGGALLATKAVTLTDCVFQSNDSPGGGGAVQLQGSGTHVLRRCTFQGNHAGVAGGAISFSSGGTGVITNCLITGNSSSATSGAIIANNGAYLTITNSTLCSNYAQNNGGAIAIAGSSTVNFFNSIAWANAVGGSTTHSGAFVFINDPANSSLDDLVSITQNADPSLADVPAASATGTLAGDFRPTAISPAIDTGVTVLDIDGSGAIAGAAGDETIDLDGETRIFDGDYDETPEIDLGCYESQLPYAYATISEQTLGDSALTATLDLGDFFGGNNLIFGVSSSSPNLLTQLDPDGNLTLSVVDTALGDSSFTVTVTATDDAGQTVQQSFAVNFELSRIYVDTEAEGTENGRSWTNAFVHLEDAIAIASEGDEIWIAKGLYLPSQSSDTTGITMLDGMSLHGGFAGGESSLDEADPTTRLTILSGDIDGDDTVDASGITLAYGDQGEDGGNTSVPLITVANDATATVSGLVICGGEDSGIRAGSGVDLTLDRCILRGNTSSTHGGGLDFSGLNLTVSDSSFLQNYAADQGGGIRCDGDASATASFDRCIISGNNSGFRGGGLGSVAGGNVTYTFRDSLLTGNDSNGQGGGLHAWTGASVFRFINCTVASNHGGGGGNAFTVGSSCRVEAENSIIWGNNSSIKANGAGSYRFESSIVEGSGGSSAWNSSYGTDAGNNLDANPGFVSAPAYWSAPQVSGDFTFSASSPARNAGDDSLSTSATDLVGNTRIQNGAIDLGAYEIFSLQAPSFTLDHNQFTLDEDAGPQTEASFADDMATNDDGQSLTGFTLSTDNDALFSALPAIDLSGTLSFTPADNASGSATVTVVLFDDGGTSNESLAQTFDITINPIDDAPTFDLVTRVDTGEDLGSVTVDDVVTNFDAIDAGQSLVGYTVTNDANARFTSQPAIDNSGTLSFTLAPDANGAVTVSVTASDDGATNNVSETKTFTLFIEGASDRPTDFALSSTSIVENTTTVGTVSATEPFGAGIGYEVTGGIDYHFFLLDPLTGVLTFATAPDFETPADYDADNVYEIRIKATGSDGSTSTTFQITVTNAPEDYNWVNTSTDQLWTTPENWNIGSLPGSVDKAYLNDNSTTLLNDGSAQSVTTLWIGDTGANGDLRLSNASQLTVSSRLVIGDGLNDMLSLSGGSTLDSNGRLQLFAGNITTIDMSGSSQWTHTFGSQVDALVQTGTVNWNVTDGSQAHLTHASETSIFTLASGVATLNLTVTGTGSSFIHSAHDLILGNGGNLALKVEDSASFGNALGGNITFGQVSGGTVSAEILTGASLITGDSLTLMNGTSLRVNAGSLDASSFSLTASSSTLENGATGSVSSVNLNNVASLTVTGSGTSLDVTNNLTLGGGGNTLDLDDGATLTVGGRLESSGADIITLTDDAVLNVGEINGNLINTSGVFSPGVGLDETELDGNYTQSTDGTLLLELGGTTKGTDHDWLNVDGPADLAGTLKINLVDDFEPSIGDSFTVLTCTGLSDSGLTFDLPDLSSGKNWDSEIGALTITLSVVASDPLVEFRSDYGLAADGSDDDSDWSENGVTNILYYLFGLGDPDEANIDRSLMPSLTESETYGYITFSYRCPFPFDPIYSVAYTSTDLETWIRLDQLSGDEAAVDVSTEMEEDGYLRYSITIPTVADRRYFRVESRLSALDR